MLGAKEISNSPKTKKLVDSECINGLIPRYNPETTPIGCYLLKPSSSDTFNGLSLLNNPSLSFSFSDPFVVNTLMDPGFCIRHCGNYFFKYAAVRKGTECRCGKENALQNYITSEGNCIFSCNFPTLNGNVTYQCGGNDAYTVYETKKAQGSISINKKLDIMANLNKNDSYQGCIEDSQFCDKRTLGDSLDENEGMTVDECIGFCRQNSSFKYAGLEAGTQCFCANNYDKVRLTSLERCSNSCSGNDSQICGGPWTLNVYDIIKFNATPTTKTIKTNLNPALVPGLGAGLGISVLLGIIGMFWVRKSYTGKWC